MATDTIRTLLAHAYPGADIALDDRTGGGDHLQVAAVSSAFDDRGQKARRGGLEVGFSAPKGFLSCSCFGIVRADRAGA